MMKRQDLVREGLNKGLTISDIEIVVLYHCSISKNEYFLVDRIDNYKDIINDFKRIDSGYPIQYVTSSCEFYGRNFYVDTRVLIPRIDTEMMIDIVLNNDYSTEAQYLDIGTGSGIIPITLAVELGGYNSISAFDISSGALQVAQKNITKYKLDDNIKIYESDLLSNLNVLDLEISKKIIITANLPYIKNNDFENMTRSTVLHEPDVALYGGNETGFELYEKLVMQCIDLSKGGYDIDLFIEIGFDQKKIATSFLVYQQLDFEFHKDSATIERVVEIHF